MKKQARSFASGMLSGVVVVGLAALRASIFTVPLFAQNCPVNPGVFTTCAQIGDAETASVSSPTAAYPSLQPVVYWHDNEWRLDMLPQPASDGEVSMKITSRDGSAKFLTFDAVHFAQVDSITRTPLDEAIVIGEPNGTSKVFSIIDLKLGKKIFGDLSYHSSISPDRRFLLYNNWDLPHVGGENLFSLYDTLKTPEENTCGYGENNPAYVRQKDELDGIQVYPRQVGCLAGQDKGDDNRSASDFIWAADSSKVVFADVKGGALSLVLVKMPKEIKEYPQTMTYAFSGAEDVCAGATSCDQNNVRSIAWNGDTVTVSLIQANPAGPAMVKSLTIPLSKFVPLAK